MNVNMLSGEETRKLLEEADAQVDVPEEQ